MRLLVTIVSLLALCASAVPLHGKGSVGLQLPIRRHAHQVPAVVRKRKG